VKASKVLKVLNFSGDGRSSIFTTSGVEDRHALVAGDGLTAQVLYSSV
jgi:hypothetical protein